MPIRPRRWFVNGIVITIPLVVTLAVLALVVDIVLGILSPVVQLVAYGWPNEPPTAVIQLATLLSLIGFFLLVGLAAEITPGAFISQRVHRAMETIPGVSTVYRGVRRASNLIVDDDTDQFEDVKLVETASVDGYMFGFLTADTPETIEHGVRERELVTLMVPLGPNPTTNGFVVHVPAENVHDVDVTVEEAVRSIATLGVAAEDLGAAAAPRAQADPSEPGTGAAQGE